MAGADSPTPAGSASAKRKLAAILHADVVGYSRLMGEDESGTHARLMAYRAVIDEIIAGHDGRVVGTAGDAVLADFPSVVEALSAAVEMQAALAERNAALPPDRKLELRIGINLGDVIVDGGDLFGDGVNVAARVESLADPGGIAISGAVHDQVRGKIDLAFHDRGAHDVKNIAEPVRVFAVGPAGQGPPQSARRRRPAVAALAAVAAIAIVAAGATLYWLRGPGGLPGSPPDAPAQDDPAVVAATSPGKPTIAVLPFEDRSGETVQGYFSDGVTEDVIADLGRFSNLLVLSWSAVAPYKGRSVAPEQLARDLDVRYVVGGSVRQAGDRLRVTVQLTDAERGLLLWSERYDESFDDVFAVQDQIARDVVAALAVRLTSLERERSFEKPTESLDAYDQVLRGRDLVRRIEHDANVEAHDHFERAATLDPSYSDAAVGLGFTHMNDFMYGWTEWPHQAIERAQALAEQAIGLDARNAMAHALLAQALAFQLQFDRAEQAIERAIALNPNNAMSHAIRGIVMNWSGRPELAVPSLELALRLDPHPAAWWPASLVLANYLLRRYGEAAGVFERFERAFAEDPAPFAVAAAAYAQLGRPEDAARALTALGQISPFFDAETYASNLADAGHASHMLEGLRKAGLK